MNEYKIITHISTLPICDTSWRWEFKLKEKINKKVSFNKIVDVYKYEYINNKFYKFNVKFYIKKVSGLLKKFS